MSAQLFFETFTINLHSAKGKQRCLFISRKSQASPCPGQSLSSLQLLRWQIHLLTLGNGIALDKEPQQHYANPIWVWGAQRDNAKIFTAKGKMAWNCICHILFFMNIELSIFFPIPFSSLVGKITVFPERVEKRPFGVKNELVMQS